MNILVSKDSKGKIRVVKIWDEWDDLQRGYVIKRITFQLGGKETVQPEIWIFKGKAKRTVTEQKNLELNSHIKKYLDKGYKVVPDDMDLSNTEALYELVGVDKTNQEGVLKPMLAKQADKVANKVFDKEYYGSRKVNGTRCLIYYKGGEIKTASRGAINYDLALFHVLNHEKLIEFFKKHPEVILDGEIYRHGLTLNLISGMCRSQSTVDETQCLEFYWYDIVDTDRPFKERYELMEEYAEELDLEEFNPVKEWEKDSLKIQFLPQIKMTGWLEMMNWHNKYVGEGWEGLVIRNVNSVYGPGKRSNDMIKIKIYQEDTFKCIGIEQGLRYYDDMVFVMETKEGKTFKAKPYGDRNQKIEYTDNFEEKYKGHLGDCKYFEISPYGIPEQPSFVAFRFDLE